MRKPSRTLQLIAGIAAIMGGGAFATTAAQTPEDKMYRPPEATIYRDAGYRGPAVFVGDAKPNLGLAGQFDSRGQW